MKLFITISRLIVGSLFIVSGLIKVNDSIGFQYKLNDYFAEGVLNLEYLIPYSLGLAVLICVVEIVLGVALIFGFKRKLTTTLVLLMMLFFTWLTWYTSSCLQDQQVANELGQEFTKNCVSDCGCFGDALKLKPIESFYKDLFLLLFAIPLFIASFTNKFPKNEEKDDRFFIIASLILIALFGGFVIGWWFTVLFSVVLYAIIYFTKNKLKSEWLSLLVAFMLPLAIVWYSLTHLPVKDFRAYATGKNIVEGMQIPEGEEEAPVHDFFMYDQNDEDITEQFLQEEKVLLVVFYDIDIANIEGLKKLKQITDDATAKGYKVFGISSSYIDDVVATCEILELDIPLLSGDGTTLKTMIRANPGIMTFNKGTVTGKWNALDANKIEL